jgi:hypothetical protein
MSLKSFRRISDVVIQVLDLADSQFILNEVCRIAGLPDQVLMSAAA